MCLNRMKISKTFDNSELTQSTSISLFSHKILQNLQEIFAETF